MKRVAIIQSSYIPWKGYFDIMNLVDEFIILDSVQYTRRDWRNRNQIKEGDRVKWLTIPVKSKGLYHQRIDEVRVLDTKWAIKHFEAVRLCYRNSPYFSTYEPLLRGAWQMAGEKEYLSGINRTFIDLIRTILKIPALITDAAAYDPSGSGSDLILDLCVKSKAAIYVTGPSARNYLDEESFTRSGIDLNWFDYSGYPEYPQQGNLFTHNVTVLDLILNTGPAAPGFMLSFS